MPWLKVQNSSRGGDGGGGGVIVDNQMNLVQIFILSQNNIAI